MEDLWLCLACVTSDAETVRGLGTSLSLETFSFSHVLSHNMVPKHKSVVSNDDNHFRFL